MARLHSVDSSRASRINGVVLVGVCAAGKTTAREGLLASGIPARSVAQEHSLVPHLYRQKDQGLLVLLVASWETVHRRRELSWNPDFYRTEWFRLAAARQDADFILHTDPLSRHEVLDAIISWWDARLGLGSTWMRYPQWDHAMKTKIREKVAAGAGLREVLIEAESGLLP